MIQVSCKIQHIVAWPADKNRIRMEVAKPVQFRLEIVDPGTDALTYEFEFL